MDKTGTAVETSTLHKTKGLIDARPRLPASADSLWDRATTERDRVAESLSNTLESLGIIGWVRKSKPGEYPLYVLVDNWRPIGQTTGAQTTERSSMKIEIKVEPYRERPINYTIELKRQSKSFKTSFWLLDADELDEMTRFLVNGGAKPRFFKSRIPIILRILPFSSLIKPRNRLVRAVRPTRITLPSVLCWGGLIGVILSLGWSESNRSHNDALVGVWAVVCIVLFILGAYLANRRPKLVSVPTQSFRTPRHEFLVDSWHVSVPEAGLDSEAFQQRLLDAISSVDPSIEFNKEIHQTLNPRGFEERERYVLTKGQANVHVHIYVFGRDVFTGWDGYLNWAKWAETEPVSNNVKDGAKTEYRSLEAGVHIPTEFDLIELNALTELVHRALVREIKGFLKEKEIETDLDFGIIRGDRERALEVGKDRNGSSTRGRHRYFSRAS